MSSANDVFLRGLGTLLSEVFDGPTGQEAYTLNPGDPGLLRQLDSLDAKTVSERPMPGRTTIAAHVDHVHYGLTLLNRWIAGEPNPWATADWSASWRRSIVDDDQWLALRTALREQATLWREGVAKRTDWDDLAATGSLASAVHTAYHLGAIRQILAAQGVATT